MGTYSFYLTTRNNAAGCIIDWESMDTKTLFKFRRFEHLYKTCNNLQALAEGLNESKLFGYFSPEMIEALCELNLHLVPYGCFPRIYYEYEGSEHIYCLEFHPGTDVVIITRYDYRHLLNSDNDNADAHTNLLMSLPERGGWTSEEL